MGRIWAERALLASGWHSNVAVFLDAGRITKLHPDTAPTL